MIFQKRVKKGADNRFHILQKTKVLMSHKNIYTHLQSWTSFVIGHVPSRSFRQMVANFSRVEF